MLKYTFSGMGGLRSQAEQRLWTSGIISWDDYRRHAPPIFSKKRHQQVLADIDEAETALARGDIRYFLQRLPRPERVRLLPQIRDRLVYLDIETTGLAREDMVTTASIYHGKRIESFIRGRNLQTLADALPPDAVLVTYNGARFDLPRLRRALRLSLRHPHLDLCPVLRAWGHTGGLKACERQLHVARSGTADLDGADAVRLWKAYQAGDKTALSLLVQYNQEDVLVLERLFVAVYNKSMRLCPISCQLPPPQQPPTGG